MKEQKHHFVRWTLPPLTLYRDDLDKLLDLLAAGGTRKTTICSGGNEFDSLDEVCIRRGDRVTDLDISSSADDASVFGSYVSVSLHREWVDLEAGDAAPSALPHEAKDFLLQRRRRRLAWAVQNRQQQHSLRDSLLLAILGLGASSRIYMKHRHELPSFWTRTKDQLLVKLLAGFFSALVVFALGVLAGRLLR